jgi:hypothetical protein
VAKKKQFSIELCFFVLRAFPFPFRYPLISCQTSHLLDPLCHTSAHGREETGRRRALRELLFFPSAPPFVPLLLEKKSCDSNKVYSISAFFFFFFLYVCVIYRALGACFEEHEGDKIGIGEEDRPFPLHAADARPPPLPLAASAPSRSSSRAAALAASCTARRATAATPSTLEG